MSINFHPYPLILFYFSHYVQNYVDNFVRFVKKYLIIFTKPIMTHLEALPLKKYPLMRKAELSLPEGIFVPCSKSASMPVCYIDMFFQTKNYDSTLYGIPVRSTPRVSMPPRPFSPVSVLRRTSQTFTRS